MISERQRIEAPPTPSVDNNMPPPPPYEEVNGVYASQTHNGSTDSMGYFLGEVIKRPFLIHRVTNILKIVNQVAAFSFVTFIYSSCRLYSHTLLCLMWS
jgi:hypothetical protein